MNQLEAYLPGGQDDTVEEYMWNEYRETTKAAFFGASRAKSGSSSSPLFLRFRLDASIDIHQLCVHHFKEEPLNFKIKFYFFYYGPYGP